MVEIVFSKTFCKFYSDRIFHSLKLSNRFVEQVKLFSRNSSSPFLADHQLQGEMKKYRAFSVTSDIRIIYQIIGDQTVRFVDIGTHEQVYGK